MRALARLPGASEAWGGHISKWGGLVYKITLTFHAVDTWSLCGSVPTGPGTDVTADTADKVSKFVAFLMQHALHFYREFYDPPEHSVEARKVAGYLLTRPDMLSVTPREVEKARRALHRQRRLTLAAMRDLENAGWVRVAGSDRDADGLTRWLVNPKIHERFAEHAVRETAMRERARSQALAAMSAQRELRNVR